MPFEVNKQSFEHLTMHGSRLFISEPNVQTILKHNSDLRERLLELSRPSVEMHEELLLPSNFRFSTDPTDPRSSKM